jgi:hypothetical protein
VLTFSAAIATRIMAMVNTPDALFAAGTPDVVDERDPWGAIQGRKGGQLLVISKQDGSVIKNAPLEAPPVLDGLACAHGRLNIYYISSGKGRGASPPVRPGLKS